ncbi:restriction endonuclease, partial [Acidobacteria bacterium AH-259-A15]|nr:restriction endonuclease [Acidobacteria bacterium AH-259-A15]
MNSKEKGDLLEKIVEQLCAGIENAEVERNLTLTGRSGVKRQIDVFIRGKVGAFDVTILVDSKNYSSPVDIKEIESLTGMVEDVGADLGVV